MTPRAYTQKEWAKMNKEAYGQAAAALVADGYTRHNRPGDMIPATFHKAGEPVLYLVRDLALTNWHPEVLGVR